MSPHDSQLDQLRQRLKDIVAQQNQAAANNSVRSSTSRAQAAAYGATSVKSIITNNNNNTGASKRATSESSAVGVVGTKDGAHSAQGNGAVRRTTSRASGMGQSAAGGGRGMGYGRGGQRGQSSGLGGGFSQSHGRGGQGQRSAASTGGDDLGLKLFETIVGLAQDGMERAARSFASSLFSTGEQGGDTPQQQQHAAAHQHSHHDHHGHHGGHNGSQNGLFGAPADSHVDGMTGASARAGGTPQHRSVQGAGRAPASHGSLASSLEEWADNFGPDSATIEDPIMAIGKQEMGQLRHDLVQGLYEGLVPAELRSRIAQDWHIGTDPFARREQGTSQGAGRGAGAGYGRGHGRGQGQGNGSHHGAHRVRTVEPFNLNPAALKQGEEAGLAAMRALQQAQMPTPQPVPPLQQTECEADAVSRTDAIATTGAEQASTLEGSSAVASTSALATEPQMSATTAALAVAEATAKAVTAQATAATAAASATAPAESATASAEAAQAQQEALEVAAAISRDFTQTSDVHMSLEERASLIKDLRTTEIMADLAAEQAMAQESAAQQAQAIASDIQQVKSQADIQLDPEQHEALRAIAAFDGLGAEESGLGAEGSALRSSLEASKSNAALNSTTTTTTTTESSTTAAPATATPAADTANSAEQTAEADNSEHEVFARTGIDHGHTHPWEQGPLHWWHEHAAAIRHQHEQVFAEIVPQLIEQLESELKLLPLEHLSAADVHAYLESLPEDENIECLGHNVFGQQMLKALTQSMREHLQALLPEAERAAAETASADTATAPAAATDSGAAANAADTAQHKATATTATVTAARAPAAPTVETTASEPDAAQIAMREDMVQGDFGPQRVTLLGATGSIGDSTCEVMRQHPELYVMHALAANSNVEKMLRLIAEFKPSRVALRNEQAAATLKERLADDPSLRALRVEVLAGDAGVVEVAGDGAAEIVVDAIVGAAGLAPVLAALKTGCRVCLANKESLVMTGQLFFDVARQFNSTVVPVDSEHSAIFQCLPPQEQRRLGACDLKAVGVHEILLTGSGGPFRDCALSELQNVTPQMAINHPVWSMGPKISVDSATMMNKALEFIEARYLFNAAPEQVRVVIHPQSVIHSMVSYVDGAVLAQLGMPDMKTPIAHALAYPHRISAPVAPLDFTKISALTFKEPDKERYPCLFMGIEASKQGQASTTALNAANEVAVAAFLHGELSFLGISEVVEEVLSKLSATTAYSLEEIMAVDEEARSIAKAVIQQRAQ